jgi:formyl-CoA transferase
VRRGNAHPTIVPYEVFAAADGHVIVAVGNDGQFRRFAAALGLAEVAEDPRFATNPARLANREALGARIRPALARLSAAGIVARLEAAKVPAGPILSVGAALASDQAAARGTVVEMPAPDSAEGTVRLLGNPLKLSRTPVTYRRPPPRFGADTAAVSAMVSGDRSGKETDDD